MLSSVLDRLFRPPSHRQPPHWVPDAQRAACSKCLAPFSALRRRSHCRKCGEVFCRTCVENKICAACRSGETTLLLGLEGVTPGGPLELETERLFEVVRCGTVSDLKILLSRPNAISLLASLSGADNLFTVAIVSHRWDMFVELDALAKQYSLDALLRHVNHFTGCTLLHTAAQCGNLDACKALVALDPQMLSRVCSAGCTPLLYACASASLATEEIVRLFLDHPQHCNVDVRDKQECTVLHRTASHGTVRLLTLFVKRMPQLDLNARSLEGETPLHFAARAGNAQMISALFSHGAQDLADNRGLRAVHALCAAPALNLAVGRFFYAESLQRLLSAGADVCSPHPHTGLRPDEMLPHALRPTASQCCATARAIVLEMASNYGSSGGGLKLAVEAAARYGLCCGPVDSVLALFPQQRGLREFLQAQHEFTSVAALLRSEQWQRWEPPAPMLSAMWLRVFQFLRPEDLFRVSCVSHEWRQLTLHSSLEPIRRALKARSVRSVSNIRHVLRPTDTLAGICLRYDCSAEELARLNHFPVSPASITLALHSLYKELLVPARVLAPREREVQPVRTAEDIRRGVEEAREKARRSSIAFLMRRFPDVEEAEAVAYLDMAANNVDEALALLERDWSMYELRYSSNEDMLAMGNDTLRALETLG